MNRTNSPALPVLNLMRDMRAQGKTWRAIADTLNGSNVRTGRGQLWYGSTVRTTLNRIAG